MIALFFGSIIVIITAILVSVGFAMLAYIALLPLLIVESVIVTYYNSSAVINERTDLNDLDQKIDSDYGKFSHNSFDLKEKNGNKISSANINRDSDRISLNNESMYPEYGYFTQTKQNKQKRAR